MERKKRTGGGRAPTLLTHNGETLSIPQWAARLGVSAFCIRRRLKAGWPVADALTAGPRTRAMGRRIALGEESLTVEEIAARAGLPAVTVRARLRRGESVHEAMRPAPPSGTVTIDGETMTMAEASRRYAVPLVTIYMRARRGLTGRELVTKRSRPRRR